MNLILAFLLSAIAAYGEISFGTASRIRRGAGAPSSGDCAVASDVGKVYIQNDLAASGSPIFACSNSGASSYSWQQATGGGGGGGGATTALDNLASVSINTALIPQSAKALGAAATPWQSLCLYGSGTFGSHSWCTAGTPTGNRTLTLPGASMVFAGSASALNSGRVPFATTGGLLTDSAGLTFTDAANVRLATLAGGSSQSTNALLDITNSAGSSHWLTVLGDGKVGIGTNAPASALNVVGAVLNNVTGVTNETYTTSGQMALTFSSGGRYGVAGSWGLIALDSTAGFVVNSSNSNLQLKVGTGGGVPIFHASTSTKAVGIGPSNTTPANATLSVLDATASTGATATWIGHDGSGTYSGVHLSALTTKLTVVAGLTQGSTNIQEWQSAAGSVLASIGPTGAWSMAGISMNGNALSTVSALSYLPNYTMSLQPVTATAAWNNGAAVRVNPTYNVSGTSVANTDLLINRTETSLGTTPGTQLLLDLQIGGVSKVSIAGIGAASVPGILGSGTWFTGGSATTTKPYLLIEPSGTTSNNWSTAGTGIGVNAASGFTGNLLQMDVASGIKFTVDSSGTTTGYYFISSLGQFASTNGTNIQMPSDGVIGLYGNTVFNRLQFGGTTSSFPALKRSTTGLIARLADDSADTWMQVKTIRPALSTVSFSATPTFDLSLGNTVKITLTANVTSSTWSNQVAGQETTLIVCQNGTGGYTFAFPAATLGAFTIGATASKCSTQKFVSDGTNLVAQGVGTIDI